MILNAFGNISRILLQIRKIVIYTFFVQRFFLIISDSWLLFNKSPFSVNRTMKPGVCLAHREPYEQMGHKSFL